MKNSNTVTREMPRYKCHKEVWALKIKSIEASQHRAYFIVPDEPGYGPFEVSVEYINKHKPEVGGYYVRYKDGYESYSPAQAFEEGYTRL